MEIKQYLSAKDFAMKHNLSPQMVRVYIRQCRIEGVVCADTIYFIPEDARLPIPGITYEYKRAEFLSIHKMSQREGLSDYYVRKMVCDGKIEGIIQVGSRKYIPIGWTAPSRDNIKEADGRIKSGKYIGWRKNYGKKKENDL